MDGTTDQPAKRRRSRVLQIGLVAAFMILAAGVGAVVANRGPAAARPQPRHQGPRADAALDKRPSPAPTTTLPPDPNVSLVAYAKPSSVPIFPEPGSTTPSSQLSNPNNLGAPLVFLVLERQAGWDRVQLPMRPNGASGWVRESDVTLYSDTYRLVVHLAAHTLEVVHDGQSVDREPVIDGMPQSPTPAGSFYITELLKAPDPNGPYGPYAFGLAAFSDVYTEFEGGPGQIAIHGTNQPYLMGQSASHGCVRLLNASLERLVGEVPVGTPVEIDA